MTLYKRTIYSVTIFALISVALMFSGCSGDDPTPYNNGGNTNGNTPGTMLGEAPDFTLTSVDGATVKLSDYNDKVVVLFFFGNTCPSCKAFAPTIQKDLADAYASRSDYAILGIDQWDGNLTSVKQFQQDTGVSFPLLLNGSATAKDYGTTYDRLIIIDKTGDIVFKGTSLASNDLSKVKTKLAELLAPM